MTGSDCADEYTTEQLLNTVTTLIALNVRELLDTFDLS